MAPSSGGGRVLAWGYVGCLMLLKSTLSCLCLGPLPCCPDATPPESPLASMGRTRRRELTRLLNLAWNTHVQPEREWNCIDISRVGSRDATRAGKWRGSSPTCVVYWAFEWAKLPILAQGLLVGAKGAPRPVHLEGLPARLGQWMDLRPRTTWLWRPRACDKDCSALS